jgi:hypothetical protein
MLEALLLLLLLKLLGESSTPELAPGSPLDYGGGEGIEEAARRRRRERERERERNRASTTPEPWPQAMPAGLPEFPAGWEYDEPPPAAVRTRAWQLLDSLWKQGKGARVTERTADRWITYRAEMTKGNKRGVVAYRMKRSRPGARPTPPVQTASQTPQTAPPSVSPASTATAGRPMLVRGSGLGALVHLQPHVKYAQLQLKAHGHYAGAIDGQFGKGTYDAVLKFQARNSLLQDGKIGPKTWAALERQPALLAS